VKSEMEMLFFHNSEPTYIMILSLIAVGVYSIMFGEKKKQGPKPPIVIVMNPDSLEIQSRLRRNGTHDDK
jgi:hypothetical protein